MFFNVKAVQYVYMYIHINLGLWYKFQVGAYSLHFRVLHEYWGSTKCHYHYVVLYSVHFRVADCKIPCCEKNTCTVFFNCVFNFGFLRFSAFSELDDHVSYFVKIKHMYTFIVQNYVIRSLRSHSRIALVLFQCVRYCFYCLPKSISLRLLVISAHGTLH